MCSCFFLGLQFSVCIVTFSYLLFQIDPLLAVLTVDHSVVDLETIEALYENVCIMAHVLFAIYCDLNTYVVTELLTTYSCLVVNVSEGSARGGGEDQETLRDFRGRGS